MAGGITCSTFLGVAAMDMLLSMPINSGAASRGGRRASTLWRSDAIRPFGVLSFPGLTLLSGCFPNFAFLSYQESVLTWKMSKPLLRALGSCKSPGRDHGFPQEHVRLGRVRSSLHQDHISPAMSCHPELALIV